LWKTDGTAAGTMLVRDIQLGPNSSAPDCLQSSQGKLIFLASEESTGTQLWQSDGAAAGTRLFVTIGASVGGAQLSGCPLQITGLELWKTNGVVTGTMLVQDIFEGPASSTPRLFVQAANQVFFAANDGTHGGELWAVPLEALDVSLEEQI